MPLTSCPASTGRPRTGCRSCGGAGPMWTRLAYTLASQASRNDFRLRVRPCRNPGQSGQLLPHFAPSLAPCTFWELMPEADHEVRTKASDVREPRDSSLPVLARFALSSRNPTAVRPAPAASGEDVVSAIRSTIDETRAVPLSAASSHGLSTLLLTSP